jgi:uncharacterized integral membrane protein (TIGR00698 family)
MKLFIGASLAFGSILVGSPLLALVFGSTFAIILKIPENYINKSIGTTFLQIGIIIIGLTMSASNALEVTAKYFPYISIFVLLVLSAGALLANLLKVDKKIGILIASGTAICGATAMAAVAPLIQAKPRDLLVSLAIIFIFNAIAIGIFPIIGSSIGMSNEQFGAWIAMAIHDTGSVMGAAMAYGGDTIETAATLKLGRTVWLIPLIVILGTFYKDKSNSKIKLPIFILVFVIAIIAGTALNLNQQNLLFLDFISDTFLVAALFCIGTQINSESIKEIDSKTFLLALGLWIIALVSSYFLINLFL